MRTFQGWKSIFAKTLEFLFLHLASSLYRTLHSLQLSYQYSPKLEICDLFRQVSEILQHVPIVHPSLTNGTIRSTTRRNTTRTSGF